MRRLSCFGIATILLYPIHGSATIDNTQLSVWANEAIVATYTYDYKNYLTRQREIAKYFTADGWVQYTKALNASKLPEAVQKNLYYVSAVATMPPEIKATGNAQWRATMPILVVYKNPQYRQKQTLNITINFMQAPSGQGIRGLVIKNLQAKVSKPACQCQPDASSPPSDTPQSPNAAQ